MGTAVSKSTVLLLALSALSPWAPVATSARASSRLPDGGYLTFKTRIHDAPGDLHFEYSRNVHAKWGASKDPNKLRKMRALIEVLIYRKLSVEFLLLAREHMRELAQGFGLNVVPGEFMPPSLRQGLELAFPKTQFRDMNAKFIEPLLSPAPFVPQFDPQTLRMFLKNLLREAANVVQLEAVRAHHEGERQVDAVRAAKVENLAEQWRANCDIRRDDFEFSRPLSEGPRAGQNKLVSILLSSLQGSDYVGERLLYTPMNYRDSFQQATGGNADVLDDVNGIRPHPTHEGTLANVIVALALQDLRFFGFYNWRKAGKEYPRSQLLCSNFSEIPFDKVSESLLAPNGPIRRALAQAVHSALRVNEEALYYLVQLRDNTAVQTFRQNVFFGSRHMRDNTRLDVEPEPADPQEMLDRFIDLGPLFWGSPDLMNLVRSVYDLGRFDTPDLIESMVGIAGAKSEKLRRIDTRIAWFSSVTVGGMLVTGFMRSPALMILMTISDAFIVTNIVWAHRTYRYQMAMVTHALFLNVEKDFRFSISPETLRDTAILDRDTYRDFVIATATMSAAGLWIAGAPGVTRLIRAVRGVTENGLLAVDCRRYSEIQRELMTIMKMLEKELPEAPKAVGAVDEFAELRAIVPALKRAGEDGLSVWDELWLKTLRYVPDEEIETAFPAVYRKLAARGLTHGMKEEAMAKKLRSLEVEPYSAGQGQGARLKTLWEVARELDLVESSLDTSRYLEVLKSTPRAARGTAVEGMINELLVPLNSMKQEMRAGRDAAQLMTVGKSLDKQVKHIRNIENFFYRVGLELDKIKFDDTQSQWVLRTMALLQWTAKWGPMRGFYQGVKSWLRKPLTGKLIPWDAIADRALAKAVWDRIPESLQNRMAQGQDAFRRTFHGNTRFTQGLDERAYDFAKRAGVWFHSLPGYGGTKLYRKPWYIDKKTVTNFWHQGVTFGPWVLLGGDRIGVGVNKFSEGWRRGDSWGQLIRYLPKAAFVDDWGQTVLNVASGIPTLLITIPISTANFTMWSRITTTMKAQWFSQILVSFTINGLKLKTAGTNPWDWLHLNFGQTTWGETMDSLFDPDCLLAIGNRLHFYPIYGGLYSAPRGRAFWIFRNILETPSVVGKTDRSEATIFVVSLLDKALFGASVFRFVSEEPLGIQVHAEGRCVKVRDPYLDLKIGMPDEDFKDAIESVENERSHLNVFLGNPEEKGSWAHLLNREVEERTGFLTQPLEDEEIEGIMAAESPVFWEMLEKAYERGKAGDAG